MNDVMDSASTRAQAVNARSELARLLERTADEDQVSLKSLYDCTAAKLYGVCLRVLRDEAEAQEVLQEVFLSVWRNAGSFDASRASPITWMATIARNRAIDRLRSRPAPTEDLTAAAHIADDRPTSLEVLETAEDASRLRGCLDELDSRAGKAIRAAFFEGATYPELAEREGVPLPTMKSWVRRGLIRLRGCLER